MYLKHAYAVIDSNSIVLQAYQPIKVNDRNLYITQPYYYKWLVQYERNCPGFRTKKQDGTIS